MQKGQRLPPKQRLRIELPDGFLDQFGPFPKSRAAGAVAVAVGVYWMVELVAEFGSQVARIATLGALSPAPPLTGLFAGIILPPKLVEEFKPGVKEGEPKIKFKELNMWGISMGVMAGGMVLAGLNPGQVLSGIGDLIDGLIPG